MIFLQAILVVFVLLCSGGDAVPLSDFYRSFDAQGSQLPQADDTFSDPPITLSTPFPFYNASYSVVYVNTNGLLSFDEEFTNFSATSFPLRGQPLIAPFWADVDITRRGTISYYQTNNTTILETARSDVLEVYPSLTSFSPTNVLIVTWDQVGHYSASVERTNTFQCVLITDGTLSFVIYLYADDLIEWTRGDSFDDFVQRHALVGFNAGDGVIHATIPESQTPGIINITRTSNIEVPGKYMYQVNAETIPVIPTQVVANVKFIEEPSSKFLSLDEVTTVRCSAYVTMDNPNLNLYWTMAGSSSPLSSNELFSSSNETIIEAGIVFVASTLFFSGSTTEVTHSLTCTANSNSMTFSREFNISVIKETVEVVIEGPLNSTLGLGDNLTISCHLVSSLSSPIFFLRNGAILENTENILVSENSYLGVTELVVVGVEHEDGGVYGCITNSGTTGGTAYNEINITIIEEPPVVHNLTVSYDGEDITTAQNQSIVLVSGSTLTVSCSAMGIPRPDFNWTANSEIINDDSISRVLSGIYTIQETLLLETVTTNNSGVYRCEAVNQAGSASEEIDLQVFDPPQILSHPNDTEVMLGEEITLGCSAIGTALSPIVFIKDGALLGSNSSRVTVVEIPSNPLLLPAILVSELLISSVELGDDGRYSCSVSNAIGNSTSSFRLSVTKAPEVVELVVSDEQHVVVGASVEIRCTATGVPAPQFSWDLAGPENYAITNNSTEELYYSILVVSHVTLSHHGPVNCTASNGVEPSSTATVNLTVLFPPQVTLNSTSQEVTKGENVTLTCSAEGRHLPTISWTASTQINNDNHMITTLAINDIALVSTLTISTTELNDTGSYNCTANNTAGTSSDSIFIQVLEAPEVVELVVSDEQRVVVGATVEICCTATGVPAPQFSWDLAGPENYAITNNPTEELYYSILVVSSVTLSQHGPVTCTASNGVEPSSTATVNLTVLFPPHVTLNSTSQEVVKGENLTLTCSTEGRHLPTISWTAPTPINDDNHMITTLAINDTALVSTLTISTTELNDTGSYNCTANNTAGTSGDSIFLQVLEAPEVVELVVSDEQHVVVGVSVEIRCTATGVPAPQFSWDLAGPENYAITNNSTEELYYSILVVSHVTLSHHGPVTCTASNGVEPSSTATVNLTVLFPPQVTLNSTSPEVVKGENVTLICSAEGRHLPTISWTSPTLINDDNHMITTLAINDTALVSTLTISTTELNDTGSYNCTANNTAGTSSDSIFIQVLEPAVIVSCSDENTSVVIGESVTLFCEARGVQRPSVEWRVRGNPLEPGTTGITLSERIIDDNGIVFELTINTSVWSTENKFSCNISNSAGSDGASFTIIIQEPAIVVIYPEDTVVLAGDSILLTCVGYGSPSPNVTWMKNGETISEDSSKYVLRESRVTVQGREFVRSSLTLCNTTNSDSDIYTCSADNGIREPALENFSISIQTVPPLILMHPEDSAVELQSSVSLACTAFGAPAPVVTWNTIHLSTTNSSVTNSSSLSSSEYRVETRGVVKVGNIYLVQSVLHVCGFSLDDIGKYICTAESSAGINTATTQLNLNAGVQILVVPNDTSAYVGDTVSLSCAGHGFPSPTITWSKDGQTLSVVANTNEISGGLVSYQQSTIVLCPLALTHDGVYTCSASNNHSTANHTFTITVNVEPQIVSYPNDSIVLAGRTVRFSCYGYGIPLPTITWKRNNSDISTSTSNTTRVLVQNEMLEFGGHLFVVAHLAICGVSESDSGRYSCSATASKREDSAEFEFTVVTIPPILIKTPEDINVVEGNGTSLVATCIAYGSPAPIIEWSFVSLNQEQSNTTQLISSIDSMVYTNQTEERGVWMVYSSLVLCPSHQSLLTSSLVSCTASNGNTTSHSFLVNVTGKCEENVTIIGFGEFVIELIWPEAESGSVIEISCPCDSIPLPFNATRRCVGSGGGVVEWAEPEHSQCQYTDNTIVLCSLPNTAELSIVTIEELSPLEVYLGAINVQRFLNSSLLIENITMSNELLEVIDHLLSSDPDVLQLSQELYNSTSLVLEGLREVMDLYPLTDNPPLRLVQNSFTTTIDFGFDLNSFTGSSASFTTTLTADQGEEPRDQISSSLYPSTATTDSDVTSYVSLSSDLAYLVLSQSEPRIIYTAFNNLAIFTERPEYSEAKNHSSFIVGSVFVMEARLSGREAVHDLDGIVSITFGKTLEAVENGTQSMCVFWDVLLDDGHGAWSTEGCRLISNDEFSATCECDHLTVFALLVDTLPVEVEKEDVGIGPYVLIGSLLSCVFLILTLLTTFFTRWKTTDGILLMNSSLALFVLNAFFVGAYFSSNSLCHGVAITLHYLFLSGAFSMSGLVLAIYQGLGRKERKSSFSSWCPVVSVVLAIWCVPGVIVSVTAGLSTPSYDTTEFCRPVDEVFNYGLILPWVVAHLPLYLCLLLLPCGYFSTSMHGHVPQSWSREYTGTVLALILFDVAWGFGLPATHPLHIGRLRFYSQIIFTVTNGCIGAIICLFFCFISSKTKESKLKQFTEPDNKQGMELSNLVEGVTADERKEEAPGITFQYDLDEVYGNPAVVPGDKEYEFQSETKFN